MWRFSKHDCDDPRPLATVVRVKLERASGVPDYPLHLVNLVVARPAQIRMSLKHPSEFDNNGIP